MKDINEKLSSSFATKVFVFSFILLNLLLKVVFAGRNDIAMDEPFSIWWALHDTNSLFGMLKTENNPALHFLLLHYWIKLFGISPLSVRLPSILFSAFSAGLIFYTGRRFFNPVTGITAALIYTLSVMQFTFAHEARVYALFTFLSLWNLYLMLSAAQKPEKKITFAYIAINNILLIYSHYFGWIPVLLQLFLLLLLPARRQLWKPLLLSFLAVLLAYIPNFLILVQRFLISSGGTWLRRPEWSELYGNINRFLNSRIVTATLLASAVAGFLIALFRKKLRTTLLQFWKDHSFVLCLLAFLLPYTGMFLISLRMPVFLDRYLLFTTPALYLSLAAFLNKFPAPEKIKTVITLIPLFVMACYLNIAPGNNRQVHRLSETIKKDQRKGKVILISPEYALLEFAYHYDRKAFANTDSTAEILKADDIYAIRHLQSIPEPVLESCTEITYIDCGSAFAFGADTVGMELKQRYKMISHDFIPGIYTIQHFRK
jgi:hypothetical protein